PTYILGWDAMPLAGDLFTTNGGTRQFLLEGIRAWSGGLTVRLTHQIGGGQADAELGRDTAYLDLKPITKPYDHYTVGDTITAPLPLPTVPEQIGTAATAAQPPLRLPARTQDQVGAGLRDGETDPLRDMVLFVHGWRMTPEERRSFAETS